MIVIADYGLGNLGSIRSMLRKAGSDAIISSEPDKLDEADKIILPGVGHFDHGMQQLKETGFLPVLERNVLEQKKPVLGICLGMQLMTQSSEEGVLPGLGWVKAKTVKFTFPKTGNKLTVPHMGWNYVEFVKSSCLTRELTGRQRFYFVHSYYVTCENPSDILAVSTHGHEFVAAFERENLFGVQFHPEKSHQFGLKVFENFLSC